MAGMFHGKHGSVIWDDENNDTAMVAVTNWQVTANADIADASAMDGSGTPDDWKQFIGGLKGWTASIETNLDTALEVALSGNTGLGGATGYYLTVYFTDAEADGVLNGTAFCTGISEKVDKADVAKVTYTFQGVGELTWDVAAPVYA